MVASVDGCVSVASIFCSAEILASICCCVMGFQMRGYIEDRRCFLSQT